MRIVGNDPTLSRQLTATASGAISAAGKPLVVNTDGTVKFAGPTSTTISAGIGSEVTFESAEARPEGGAFDSNSNKVVITYADSGNSGYGTAIVGTIDDSDNSISFGTAVVFNSAGTDQIDSTFDSSNNKVVIAYRNYGSGGHGQAIVGTVSGTSISFGSATSFFSNSNGTSYISLSFDTNVNKVLIAYSDNIKDGYGIAGTVSGTDISFGSAHRFETDLVYYLKVAFDSSSNTHVAVFVNYSNSQYGEGCVLQVASDGTVSSQTPVVYESSEVQKSAIAFDTTNNKFLVAFRQSASSGRGTGIVATVSGTTLSFGTKNDWNSSQTQTPAMVFNDASGTFVILYDEGSGTDIKYIEATISGTSVTFGSAAVADTDGSTDYNVAIFDSNLKRTVLIYQDSGESSYGKARVLASAATYNVNSLTSENFIGTSAHAAADGAKILVNTQGAIDENIPQIAQAAGYGSVVQFDAGNLSTGDSNALAFDSSNNKVVLIYRDNGNSNYGTALVGTIDTSDDSISWGSATVFESASIGGTSLTFDSSNNKVVGFFHDIGDSNVMKSIVGTVSGTSISFGSVANVSTAGTANAAATFDTNSNKVVVAFTDSNNSGYGTARVGTVSGTSISFGTAVVFTSAEANIEADCITFDSSNNRVVIAYTLSSGTNRGNAIVGTVSGTDISFGTQVAFNTNFSSAQTATFDTSNNKVVIAFQDSSNSDQGTAVVGTVSGSSISFGSETIFNAAGTDTISSTFDSNSNTVLVSYRDTGDNNNGTIVVGTVSGTSISFGSENKYTTGDAVNTYNSRIIYDSNAKRAVVIYTEGGASGRGDSRVFRPAANLDLTAGQTYFVQTDGSLSETADSPSVTAGTALSATKLLVKG